jgi:hypothetical protein
MELAADLDAHTVEMHIVAESSESIAIVCPRDSILAIQEHIEKLAKECPEIATWSDQHHGKRNHAESPRQPSTWR